MMTNDLTEVMDRFRTMWALAGDIDATCAPRVELKTYKGESEINVYWHWRGSYVRLRVGAQQSVVYVKHDAPVMMWGLHGSLDRDEVTAAIAMLLKGEP